VSFGLNYEINASAEQLRKNPAAVQLFFHADGTPYDMGDTWRQPDLAWTLGRSTPGVQTAFIAAKWRNVSPTKWWPGVA
jgi:gamma-glutamyltranspeptidase/glutathione hydrolase